VCTQAKLTRYSGTHTAAPCDNGGASAALHLQWQWLCHSLACFCAAPHKRRRRNREDRRCGVTSSTCLVARTSTCRAVSRACSRLLDWRSACVAQSYVHVTHALHVLQGECTYQNVVRAMRELLEGWSLAEEEHSLPGGYQHRLLNVIDDIHGEIVRFAGGQWD